MEAKDLMMSLENWGWESKSRKVKSRLMFQKLIMLKTREEQRAFLTMRVPCFVDSTELSAAEDVWLMSFASASLMNT